MKLTIWVFIICWKFSVDVKFHHYPLIPKLQECAGRPSASLSSSPSPSSSSKGSKPTSVVGGWKGSVRQSSIFRFYITIIIITTIIVIIIESKQDISHLFKPWVFEKAVYAHQVHFSIFYGRLLLLHVALYIHMIPICLIIHILPIWAHTSPKTLWTPPGLTLCRYMLLRNPKTELLCKILSWIFFSNLLEAQLSLRL